MTFAELKLKWNQEHIIQHRLAEDVLAEAQIEKLEPTEICVEHPKHEGY